MPMQPGVRRFVIACSSTSHSPGPFSFSPLLSTGNCSGPVFRCVRFGEITVVAPQSLFYKGPEQ